MKTKFYTLLAAIWLSMLMAGATQAQVITCLTQFTSVDSAGYQFFTLSSYNSTYVYSWNFGDNTTATSFSPYVVHQYNATGNYMVCLTAYDTTNGCNSTWCDTAIVTSGSNCTSNFSYQATGSQIQFAGFSNASIVSSWQWSFGDGTAGTGQNATHAYATTGSYYVCLTVTTSNGCTSTYCQNVYVANGSTCNAQFTHIDSLGYVSFIPNNNNPNNNLYYYWSFGDNTVSTSSYPVHHYNSNGYWSVCLTIIDSTLGCTATYCDSVYTNNTVTCTPYMGAQVNGNTINFYGNGNGSQVVSWFWDFGDGSIATTQNPAHTYSSAGTYYTCLTITTANGCSGSTCNSYTIASSVYCNAQFNYIDSLGSVYFTPYTNNPNNNISYYWQFGDGTTSSQAYPIHQYNGVGPYGACLTITDSLNSCSSTWCDTVFTTGSSTCTPSYYAQISGNSIYFAGYSNAFFVVSWTWSFGDGTSSNLQNPTHVYTSAGNYQVCLTVVAGNGCTGTYCQYNLITTSTTCNAQFQSADSAGYTYFIPSMGNPVGNVSYLWSFGDGTSSTQQYPVHQYNSIGPWTVCLIVTDSINNCTSTWCNSITSSGSLNCNANFVYTADSLGTVVFTDLSNSANTINQFYWYFGDGTNDSTENPVHHYSNPGTYVVCLTIYNSNCQSAHCDTIIIGSGSNCIPTFYSYPDSTYGNGTVNFGVYNGCPGYTYTWSFGDSSGTTSGTTPIHLYAVTGWYEVCCTGTNQNGNTTSFCDSVFAFRIGHFTGIAEAKSQLPVQLYPNPTDGPFTLKFHLNSMENVVMEIISIDGKVCLHTENTVGSGDHEIKVDAAELSSGLYLVRIKAGNQQASARISIAH